MTTAHGHAIRQLLLCALWFTSILAAAPTAAAGDWTPTRTRTSVTSELDAQVIASIHTLLDGDLTESALEDAVKHFQELSYATFLGVRSSDSYLFARTGLTSRLLSLLHQHKAPADLVRDILSNEQLALTLGASWHEQDNHEGVLRVLTQLREEFGMEAIAEYPSLTVALAVVHDTTFRDRINENTRTAPAVTDIFEHLVTNERKLWHPLESLHVPLAVHMVNTTASRQEMQWAVNKYRKASSLGPLYTMIEYDYNHFQNGEPKKVTLAGFNLQNILKHGGVCADQAYFSMTVGKSLGVPTTYTRANGLSVGHAWLGFLAKGRRGAGRWDFSAGCWPEYQLLAGEVRDPQLGVESSEAVVALTGDLLKLPIESWLGAEGMALIATTTFDASTISAAERRLSTIPRYTLIREGISGQNALLQSATRVTPAAPGVWRAAQMFLAENELSQAVLKEWSRFIAEECVGESSAFAIEMMSAITEQLDAETAHNVWEWVFERYSSNEQLAARTLYMWGRNWEHHGDNHNAYLRYKEIIDSYAGAGDSVLLGLHAMRPLLYENGKGETYLHHIAMAAAKIPPLISNNAFTRNSSMAGRVRMLAEAEIEARGKGEDMSLYTNLKRQYE